MKFLKIIVPVASVLVMSCETGDPCDDGFKPHQQNGQTICIPDFLGSKNLNPKLGNTYFHKKYGVVTIQNGIWKDNRDQIIDNIDE